MELNTYLAIDIGGSKIMCAFMLEDGTILRRLFREVPTLSTFDNIWAIILDSVKELQQNSTIKFSAIGVTIPGLADPEKGEWIYAPFSNIHNIKIVDLLEKRFHVPVYIENDVNACALAEQHWGKCKNTNSFIWVTVSTGVGSGIILNQKLFNGAYGFAGELGHICVEYDPDIAIPCGCGCNGCVEAMAAGPGIVKRYQKYVDTAPPGITAKQIGDLAERGDQIAQKVFKETGIYLARALASAVNLFNPNMIVLGGGISMRYHLFEDSLKTSLQKHIIQRGNQNLQVTSTALKYDAALYGALTTILTRQHF